MTIITTGALITMTTMLTMLIMVGSQTHTIVCKFPKTLIIRHLRNIFNKGQASTYASTVNVGLRFRNLFNVHIQNIVLCVFECQWRKEALTLRAVLRSAAQYCAQCERRLNVRFARVVPSAYFGGFLPVARQRRGMGTNFRSSQL